MWQAGWLRSLENLSEDARFKARGPIEAPVKLIYVDIDPEAITTLGNWPWERGIFAKVCSGLVEQGARAVGIDVVFSSAGIPNIADMAKVERGQAEFARYLVQGPPVVLAASYASGERITENGERVQRTLPEVRFGRGNEHPETPELKFGKVTFAPPLVGLIDTLNGETRRVPLFAPVKDKDYLHIALELSRLYWGVSRDGVKIGENSIDLTDTDGRVRRVPMRRGQMLDINWFSKWADDERNPRVSISTVLTALQYLKSSDPEAVAEAKGFFTNEVDFRDAVVLIGPVDPLMQDLAPTSFDRVPVPKVGVHGNLVKTIISGRYLTRPPDWGIVVITLGLTAVVVVLFLGAEGQRSAQRRVLAALVLGGYVGFCFIAFSNYDLVLPMTAPLGAAFSSAMIGGSVQLILAQKQKSRIKGLFGAYLAPAVVSQMVDAGEEPKLGGVEEHITAYFSDVQSFSTFSEKLSATQLVELMNEYLTACTDIVQAEGGTLDKFIGDAVVAMYGAPLALPGHAQRACVAALRVQKRCAELREKWRHEPHKNWPEVVLKLQTRIGLNTGRAVVGNMGSATRFNYTMMGDTVNLAARMESGAKAWGVYTMCAEPTRRACEETDLEGQVVFRELGRVVVKGRAAPVPIHEIVGLKAEVTGRTREAIARFEAGLKKYYAQDWDAALADFTASAELEPLQPDEANGVLSNPSLVYQKLVAELRANPPGEDWNGAYVMREK